jgi:hypothetical protein
MMLMYICQGIRSSHHCVALQLQAWFYITSCLSEDLESQRLGYVFILFLHHVSFGDVDLNRGISQVMNNGLIRISGFHICSPENPHNLATQATVLLMIGASIRSRVRFHIGQFMFSFCPFQRPLWCLIGSSPRSFASLPHMSL